MVKGFFSFLNQNGSGSTSSKTRRIFLCHRVQFLAVVDHGLMMDPCLGEYSKDISFSYAKKEIHHWDAQGQMSSLNSSLKAMLFCSSLNGLGLLFFSEMCKGLAIRERFGIQFWQ